MFDSNADALCASHEGTSDSKRLVGIANVADALADRVIVTQLTNIVTQKTTTRSYICYGVHKDMTASSAWLEPKRCACYFQQVQVT